MPFIIRKDVLFLIMLTSPIPLLIIADEYGNAVSAGASWVSLAMMAGMFAGKLFVDDLRMFLPQEDIDRLYGLPPLWMSLFGVLYHFLWALYFTGWLSL